MTLEDLIDACRSDADDRADPPLFSDEDLAGWLNEAETEAAIRARLLFDDSYSINVVRDQSGYPFNKLFLINRAALYNVVVAEPARPSASRFERVLIPTTREQISQINVDWRTSSGCPEYFIQEETRVFLPCLVDRAYLLKLEGYRVPLVPMNADLAEQVKPEIQPIHHRGLVNWALFRGYSRPDSETFNPGKAADAEGRFERQFGKNPGANMLKNSQANRPHFNTLW